MRREEKKGTSKETAAYASPAATTERRKVSLLTQPTRTPNAEIVHSSLEQSTEHGAPESISAGKVQISLDERQVPEGTSATVMRMSDDSAVPASTEIRPTVETIRETEKRIVFAGESKASFLRVENELKGFSKLIGVYLPAVTLHPIGRWIVLLLECGLIAAAAYGCRRVKTDFNYV